MQVGVAGELPARHHSCPPGNIGEVGLLDLLIGGAPEWAFCHRIIPLGDLNGRLQPEEDGAVADKLRTNQDQNRGHQAVVALLGYAPNDEDSDSGGDKGNRGE